MKYWINTVSKDHVLKGAAGGFTQANHGSPKNLKRMNIGDWILFYSPSEEFKSGKPLQMFTAIGKVIDDEPYQAEMTPDFHPYRRDVKFFEANETSIKPLIEKLSFIQNKSKWGYPFRRGMFEIPRKDFELIAQQMGVELE